MPLLAIFTALGYLTTLIKLTDAAYPELRVMVTDFLVQIFRHPDATAEQKAAAYAALDQLTERALAPLLALTPIPDPAADPPVR